MSKWYTIMFYYEQLYILQENQFIILIFKEAKREYKLCSYFQAEEITLSCDQIVSNAKTEIRVTDYQNNINLLPFQQLTLCNHKRVSESQTASNWVITAY